MLKTAKTLILIINFLLLLSSTCNASETPIKLNDLIENSIIMDGKAITVQGEVIGEALERGEYAWININDVSNSLGIWIKSDSLSDLNYYGSYKKKGDIVQITGVFHRACREHGGDIDIHCTDIAILSKGHNMEQSLSLKKLLVALILCLIVLPLSFFYIKNMKKQN